ncbi:MAG: hypothetical protein ACO2PP_03555 [Thermocrinis sp.]|jgi:hypothetical protein|uniref:hypothetical protein n=1 Tax=Thermocrinis sp. TaxID=2024383 RepID=UPI003BFBE10C
MARNSWLIPYFALEEEGKPLYDQAEFCNEGNISKEEIADQDIPPPFSFNIFIDGTMRLYNVGTAIPYTPLFLAVVSVAVLRRKSRRLFHTGISNSLTLLLFPFETYREYLQTENIKVSYADIERSINNFRRKFVVFKEQDLDYRRVGGREIFRSRNVLLVCDTSKRGIVQKDYSLISKEDLNNPKKIKEAATARVRYIMGLLEFSCLLSASDRFSDSYILKDGLIERYSRVKNIFGIDRQTYQDLLKNVVGFIKYPRKIPPEVMANMLHLEDFEYYRWVGKPEDDGEDSSSPSDMDELFNFALLRFRRLPRFSDAPVGIVKLQTLKTDPTTDNLKDIIKAVLQERYPLPSNHRRIYSEPYPISEAEKVAKAQLPSEAKLRGLVYALMG